MDNAELRIENKGAKSVFLNSQFFILNSLLLLFGHFLPWAAHATSALTQSGHELAFSTNFTPGAGIFANEWFFMPAWCSALLMALAFTPALTPTHHHPSSIAQGERELRSVVFGGIALIIASLGFPAYPQVLTAFRSPDFRAQFFGTLGVMAGVVALLLIPEKRMPRSAPALITLACGVLSLVPVIGFLAVKPAIEMLYGGAVGLGAGWWITLGASALLIAPATMSILRHRG